ncbi:IKI3 family protein [Isosphaera pallida ATCC 43644]|uniref:IKI3 family protein n=1 Tax=Isosphaera pallida (strain ATCC 43644 / DSM 9630 / IS1B) TaxID=575540 RepID=E8QYS5_ISOPI|nr:IKI3 family protein [Isosphaera pallida ATCC 43644]
MPTRLADSTRLNVRFVRIGLAALLVFVFTTLAWSNLNRSHSTPPAERLFPLHVAPDPVSL